MHFSHWLSHYYNANEGNIRPTAGSLKWVCKEMNRTEIQRGDKGDDDDDDGVWMTLKSRKTKKGIKLWNESEVYAAFSPAGWWMCSCSPPNEHTGNNVTACLEPKGRLSEKVCVCFFVCFLGGSVVSFRLGNPGCAVNIHNIFLFCSECCSLSASAGRPKRMAESHSSKLWNQIQKCAYNLLFCTALTKTTANCNDGSWILAWQAETVTHTRTHSPSHTCIGSVSEMCCQHQYHSYSSKPLFPIVSPLILSASLPRHLFSRPHTRHTWRCRNWPDDEWYRKYNRDGCCFGLG